ncbi:MAG: hypothetical protein JWQ71_3963 [Pedosphaera sp.]|nr:hypothetical protein [Pedosphaera sp.]
MLIDQLAEAVRYAIFVLFSGASRPLGNSSLERFPWFFNKTKSIKSPTLCTA